MSQEQVWPEVQGSPRVQSCFVQTTWIYQMSTASQPDPLV